MMDIWHIGASFVVGIAAAWYGAQIGGDGLLSVPALLFLGVPPHVAIAAHRVSGFFGGMVGLRKYWQHKKINWKLSWPLLAIRILASWIGVQIFLNITPDSLKTITGWALLLPLPFVFIKDLGLKTMTRNSWIQFLGFLVFCGVAIWGGVFGAGAGILALYTLVIFFGLTFIEAKATMELPNVAARAFLTFLLIEAGVVDWSYAIPLSLGYIIGAQFGVSYALQKGNTFVRWLLLAVVIASSIKILFF